MVLYLLKYSVTGVVLYLLVYSVARVVLIVMDADSCVLTGDLCDRGGDDSHSRCH